MGTAIASQAGEAPRRSTLPYDTARQAEQVKLLAHLVQFASLSGQEGEVGRYLSNYCQEMGLHVRRFSTLDSSYNFAASLFPLASAKPNIVLLSHLDVVPADTVGWTHDPFSGHRQDSIIYGRGTLDAKGMSVMQLMAIRTLLSYRDLDLPYNVTLLCVSGEETGGQNGSAIITRDHLAELHPAAVFGEGGSGLKSMIPGRPFLNLYAISIAEKSNLWLQLDIKFKSHAHGAAAPSNYANKAMLKALYKLQDVNTPIQFTKTSRRMFKQLGQTIGGREGFLIRHINWWIFRPVLGYVVRREPLLESLLTNTAVLTHLSNPPGAVNQISTRATAQLDCRLLPGTNRKQFLRKVRYGLFEPRFTVSILNENPEAEETPLESPFWASMERAVQHIDPLGKCLPVLFPASSDNNYYRAKGIPVFGITPILATRSALESIHNIEEQIPYTELERGVLFYHYLLADILRLPPINAQAEAR